MEPIALDIDSAHDSIIASSIVAPHFSCSSREDIITERPFRISPDNSASNTPACCGGSRHLVRNRTTALTLPFVSELISRRKLTFSCHLASPNPVTRRDPIHSSGVDFSSCSIRVILSSTVSTVGCSLDSDSPSVIFATCCPRPAEPFRQNFDPPWGLFILKILNTNREGW